MKYEVRTYDKKGNRKEILFVETLEKAELIWYKEQYNEYPAPTIWQDGKRLAGY